MGGIISQVWGGHNHGGASAKWGGHQPTMGGPSAKYGGVISQVWVGGYQPSMGRGVINELWGLVPSCSNGG